MKVHLQKESVLDAILVELEKIGKVVNVKGTIDDFEVEFEKDLTSTELTTLTTTFQKLNWKVKEVE